MSDPAKPSGSPARQTLRLRFRYADGAIALISKTPLAMTCPPAAGPRPEIGRNGGFWIELHDDSGQTTFHRTLHDPLATSVEVHSPDGNIRREFGPPQESEFEVLVPDDPRSQTLLIVGDPEAVATTKRRRKAKTRPASAELQRFDLSDPPATSPRQGDER